MATYRESGVNIDAQDEALREVRRIVRDTFTPAVMSDIGSYGGLFRGTFDGIEKPVLVSSTDGVGTKLRVAQAMKIHDTVGYDLVCHCVNDILAFASLAMFMRAYWMEINAMNANAELMSRYLTSGTEPRPNADPNREP